MAEFDMGSIKPNSNKSKEQKEKKKYNPVIKKEDLISSKKSIGNRLMDAFLDTDARDIKGWLIREVLIPGLKDTALDFMSMIFYGETSHSNRKRRRSEDHGYVNYGGYYSGERKRRRRSEDHNRYYDDKNDYDYRGIKLREYRAAEDVVDQLRDIIRDEGSVSIATFFELLDIPSSFNDNNWGWTRERQIGIRSTRDGYLIDVDEAEYIG